MTTEYIAFHGSDLNNKASILSNNFHPSKNEKDWLGHGVYFFIDGVSDPVNNATEWAKNQAFTREGWSYDKYGIFQAKVVCERVLDVTNIEGLKFFNVLRNRLIEKNDEHFERNRDKLCDDQVMWNLVASVAELDAVIHNLYIKNKTQRIKKIMSNVPNTTVLCVKEPASIIKDSIEVLQEGDVR